MTLSPEEFLKEIVEVIAPVLRQTGESFKTMEHNFQAMSDRFDKDHAQIRANFEAVHRDMVTTQKNIEATHQDVVELRSGIRDLLEISRSHERRLGLLETEAPTGPIRKKKVS